MTMTLADHDVNHFPLAYHIAIHVCFTKCHSQFFQWCPLPKDSNHWIIVEAWDPLKYSFKTLKIVEALQLFLHIW